MVLVNGAAATILNAPTNCCGKRMDPLIINLAPTGLTSTQVQSPHLPLSPETIAEDVDRCAGLSVSMAHLHARELDGAASDDPAIFAEIVTRVRARRPDLVIVTTTSGRRSPEIERRASSLYLEGDAKPDMASLTLGSINFAAEPNINPPATIMRLAAIMRERGIKPELEVFDLGMINFAKVLIDKELIQPPFYFNILLGSPSGAQLDLIHLGAMIKDLPEQSLWSLAGIGRFQARANGLGVVMAHGVRVGLEDNLWLDDERTELATNACMVERITAQAAALGRPIATAAHVRDRLGLEPRA
jgi:3-keto-5-aminohexanoate cleavage enzyme